MGNFSYYFFWGKKVGVFFCQCQSSEEVSGKLMKSTEIEVVDGGHRRMRRNVDYRNLRIHGDETVNNQFPLINLIICYH